MGRGVPASRRTQFGNARLEAMERTITSEFDPAYFQGGATSMVCSPMLCNVIEQRDIANSTNTDSFKRIGCAENWRSKLRHPSGLSQSSLLLATGRKNVRF